MRGWWRLLALAGALHVVVGAGQASAQTVVVRRAPAGSAAELVVNTTTVATATADARGDAILPLNLAEHTGKSEAGLNIFVDVCDAVHRVLLLERGVRPPPPGPSCDRRDVIGLFLVRSVSTVIVHVDGATPRVLLIQGRYNLDDPGPGRLWAGAPAGIAPFVGGGFRTFRDFQVASCGNVPECSGGGAGGGYTAGAVYWVTPFFGAEGSFVKPAEAVASGSGDTFQFRSSFDARLATVGGVVGVPIGSVRLYGKVGANHHWATFSTTQTDDPVTTIVDGVEETLPAATQTFELRTKGWGWQFGGGGEIWVTRGFGIYGEFGRLWLKGPAIDADGELDDAATTIFIGVRFRIGG